MITLMWETLLLLALLAAYGYAYLRWIPRWQPGSILAVLCVTLLWWVGRALWTGSWVSWVVGGGAPLLLIRAYRIACRREATEAAMKRERIDR